MFIKTAATKPLKSDERGNERELRETVIVGKVINLWKRFGKPRGWPLPGKHGERTGRAPPGSTVGKRQNAQRNANVQVLMASKGPGGQISNYTIWEQYRDDARPAAADLGGQFLKSYD